MARTGKVPVCFGCKHKITDRYVVARGQHWHHQCLVCNYCHEPLLVPPRHSRLRLGIKTDYQQQNYIEHKNNFYHINCYAEAFNKRCDVCSNPLVGRFYTDGRGYQFCAHHLKKHPRCFSCHRLICQSITGGGVQLRDGRALCHVCKPSAVTSMPQARKAFQDAKDFLNQIKMDVSTFDIPLCLADQRGMRKSLTKTELGLDTRRPACGHMSMLIRKRGNQVLERSVQDITILHHLSRIHFTSVAVHELCHAWLFYREFGPLPIRVEEGLCVFMEYQYLKHVSTAVASAGSTLQAEAMFLMRLIEENNDPIYGDGFRAALHSVNRFGFTHTVKNLDQKKYWPGTTPLRDDMKMLWKKIFSK